MSGGTSVEPVERCSELVGDLRQVRIRGKRVAGQCCRPAVRQDTLGEAGKGLLTAALPITAVDVNETRRLRIVRGIEIPLCPLAGRIRQIEVRWVLLAQSSRSCDPVLRLLPSEIGAHMRDIIESQVARLE